MAYTPINWDEITPITPANLNKMDGQIDTNENDLRGHDNDISTLDGRVDGNDNDISNHEGRISTNENELDIIQGGETAVDGRISNLEEYIVGNTIVFQSLSTFETTFTSYVTAKEILVGKGKSARLTFEMRIDGGLSDHYADYRILVDGSEVASGGHSGTREWVNHTEDISFQTGSNIKVQIRENAEDIDKTVELRNFRFRIGNQSDVILEL